MDQLTVWTDVSHSGGIVRLWRVIQKQEYGLRLRGISISTGFVGSLALPLSRRYKTRSKVPVFDGQHHIWTVYNEQMFVPFSLKNDRSHSYLSSIEETVASSVLPSKNLQRLDRRPVSSEMTLGIDAFKWFLSFGVNALLRRPTPYYKLVFLQ